MDTPRAVAEPGEATHSPTLPRESGQALVIVAVILVALVGLLGLVIDGGNVYAQRRQMQNAADAAALAGARALILQGPDAVEATAQEYASTNGATNCAVEWTSTQVRVVVSKTIQTFFVRVLGIDTMPAAATATASVETADALACGFLPLTIPYRTPEEWPQGEFAIWQKVPESYDITSTVDIQPSMCGWLNLDGHEAPSNEPECWVCPDCTSIPNPGVDLGWTNGTSGTSTNALHELKRCVEGKVVYIPLYGETCCWMDKTKDAPECWQDAWDSTEFGTGQCNYEIVAFAPFHVTHVKDTGNPRAIYGHYEPNYVGDDCVISGGDGENARLYKVRLIQ